MGGKGLRQEHSKEKPEMSVLYRVEIKLTRGVKLPAYQTHGASGLDLSYPGDETIELRPMQIKLIQTGVSIAIPGGYEGQVRPRSGLSIRHGVTLVNTPGTIDADYRGEIGVALINLGDTVYRIQPGERVAQLVIAPVAYVQSFTVVNELEKTSRGSGGYGSTGR